MTRLAPQAITALASDTKLRAGPAIAIASGKGGVGKTWLAITLAAIMSGRGEDVLLFDGDCGLANIDIQLGLTPVHDLFDYVSGRTDLDGAISACPGPDDAYSRFKILPGRSGAAILTAMPTGSFDQLLMTLRSHTAQGCLLLDLGAGIDRIARRLAAWADTLLVVTTEEPTALADAYAVLKLHAHDRQILTGKIGIPPDNRIIVNQASTIANGERTYATLARACASFLGHRPPLAGIIRRDPKVGEAIRRQALLVRRHPNSLAATDVAAIVTQLGR